MPANPTSTVWSCFSDGNKLARMGAPRKRPVENAAAIEPMPAITMTSSTDRPVKKSKVLVESATRSAPP